MPASLRDRSTLSLVGLAARRGEDDLRALAALARGERVTRAREESLLRAGLLIKTARGTRLPPRLIGPVLALEAALGLAGEDALASLLALLRGARAPAERNGLLEALAVQLSEELQLLRERAAAPGEDMVATLECLRRTVSGLAAAEADPAFVTRVAALCARLIEELAGALTSRRRAPTKQLLFPAAPILAATVSPLYRRPLQLRSVPTAGELASALAALAPRAPLRVPRLRPAPMLDSSERAQRIERIERALDATDPIEALYGSLSRQEALLNHAALACCGWALLRQRELRPSGERRSGPAPLLYSTELERTRAGEQAKAA